MKYLYLARIGRPDILWSLNKLARAVTKWTKACDKRLARLISYIHKHVKTNSIAMWETLPNNADGDCFRTPILQEILRIQNLHQVEHFAFLWPTTILSQNLHSSKNTGKDLTMEQMFDTSEKLIVGQSDGIYGVKTIDWDDSSWKHLSLIGGEEVVSLSHPKVYVFSDFVSWKDEREPTIKYFLGRKIGVVQKFTGIPSFGDN